MDNLQSAHISHQSSIDISCW